MESQIQDIGLDHEKYHYSIDSEFVKRGYEYINRLNRLLSHEQLYIIKRYENKLLDKSFWIVDELILIIWNLIVICRQINEENISEQTNFCYLSINKLNKAVNRGLEIVNLYQFKTIKRPDSLDYEATKNYLYYIKRNNKKIILENDYICLEKLATLFLKYSNIRNPEKTLLTGMKPLIQWWKKENITNNDDGFFDYNRNKSLYKQEKYLFALFDISFNDFQAVLTHITHAITNYQLKQKVVSNQFLEDCYVNLNFEKIILVCVFVFTRNLNKNIVNKDIHEVNVILLRYAFECLNVVYNNKNLNYISKQLKKYIKYKIITLLKKSVKKTAISDILLSLCLAGNEIDDSKMLDVVLKENRIFSWTIEQIKKALQIMMQSEKGTSYSWYNKFFNDISSNHFHETLLPEHNVKFKRKLLLSMAEMNMSLTDDVLILAMLNHNKIIREEAINIIKHKLSRKCFQGNCQMLIGALKWLKKFNGTIDVVKTQQKPVENSINNVFYYENSIFAGSNYFIFSTDKNKTYYSRIYLSDYGNIICHSIFKKINKNEIPHLIEQKTKKGKEKEFLEKLQQNLANILESEKELLMPNLLYFLNKTQIDKELIM